MKSPFIYCRLIGRILSTLLLLASTITTSGTAANPVDIEAADVQPIQQIDGLSLIPNQTANLDNVNLIISNNNSVDKIIAGPS